jgi:hypothetical protein
MNKYKTKFIIGLFALTAIGMSSCANKQQIQDNLVRKNFEEYFRNREINFDNNYEFEKIELKDSVLYSANIEFFKEWFRRDLDFSKNYLNDIKSYKTNFPTTTMSEEEIVKILKNNYEENQRILSKIDSLEAKMGNKTNEVASYTYILSGRINSALQGEIIREYIVQTGPKPDLKIINIARNKDEMHETPNDFPGYREMLKKNRK